MHSPHNKNVSANTYSKKKLFLFNELPKTISFALLCHWKLEIKWIFRSTPNGNKCWMCMCVCVLFFGCLLFQANCIHVIWIEKLNKNTEEKGRIGSDSLRAGRKEHLANLEFRCVFDVFFSRIYYFIKPWQNLK